MVDLNNIFSSTNQTGGVRWLNKSMSVDERRNYNNWWVEQIHHYGVTADYYTNSYSLSSSAHENLYGEDPTSTYEGPYQITFCLNLNENAVVMQKFGLVAEDEITGYIAIDSFYHSLSTENNLNPEPKSGDVLNLVEYGMYDRPGGRGGKWFEITERLEQDVSQINPLLGHYVWLIKCKRFEFSFEPGLSGEKVSAQVYDDAFSGLLSGYTQEQSPQKAYIDNITVKSKEIFDYELYESSNTNVYGGYTTDTPGRNGQAY